MHDDIDIPENENLAATLARVLPEATVLANGNDLMTVALPAGFSLETIDGEKFNAGPRRKKGAAKFSDVASFVTYVNGHAEDGTTAWCNFNPQTFSLSFMAVLNDHSFGDPGDPGWRDHRAAFTPVMSAEWNTWKGKDKAGFSQVDFAEFIEANAEDFVAKPGYPSDLQMMTMATNFVAHEEHRLKSTVRLQSGGVRLEYVADADAGTVETMDAFSKFCIGIPVFQGTQDGKAWPIDARLKYRTPQGKVTFLYELIRHDRVHELAAKQLIDEVREGLGTIPLLMGSFD